ncbi:GNAT family N-acetyltransferase [Yoonia sp. R2331]|uniref:GNAT family N-acetyltransferase n=1 Tax=Yoonia sp. R2331 TaxID=3237238 RepID=UPI0034E4D944
MADALILRRAVASDAQGLVRVVKAAYAAFADLDLPPVAEGLDADIRDHPVWVAELDGQIVGGIVLILSDPPKIANLAVDPNVKGQGLGRKLVNLATDAARAAGHRQVQLTTHADMSATRAFYARLGWTDAGQDGNKVYMTLQL